MSIKLMAQVWELNLPRPEKFFLLALADYANDAGIAYPSVASVCRKCGYDTRTGKRIKARLVERGILRRLGASGIGPGRGTDRLLISLVGVPTLEVPGEGCQNDTASDVDKLGTSGGKVIPRGDKTGKRGDMGATQSVSTNLKNASGGAQGAELALIDRGDAAGRSLAALARRQCRELGIDPPRAGELEREVIKRIREARFA